MKESKIRHERAGHTHELSTLPQRYPIEDPLSPRGSFHFDVHAHPGMDTAFEMMCAFRQTRDLDLAALEEPSPGHCDPGKASGTFGDCFLSRVELWYEASAEISPWPKSVPSFCFRSWPSEPRKPQWF
jgi:hypothetical protein